MLRPRDGGERELAAIDTAAGEVSLSWPVTVAGDRFVLFVSRRKGSGGTESRLEAVPTGGGPRHVVLDGVQQAIFASADRIVFERAGALFWAPFDGERGALDGAPVRLGESALIGGAIGGLAASVADSGALLAAPQTVLESHLVWVSVAGAERPLRGAARGFLNPRVSPDGRLVAFSESGTIWTLDPERSTFTRVYGASASSVGFPLWSPDGTRIYYRSAEGIRYQSADGEGASTVLPNTGSSDYPNSISADGSTLVLLRLAAATAGDIYATPAGGGELKPLLVTSAYEGGGQISPDGKWLLYVSNESGRTRRPAAREDSSPQSVEGFWRRQTEHAGPAPIPAASGRKRLTTWRTSAERGRFSRGRSIRKARG